MLSPSGNVNKKKSIHFDDIISIIRENYSGKSLLQLSIDHNKKMKDVTDILEKHAIYLSFCLPIDRVVELTKLSPEYIDVSKDIIMKSMPKDYFQNIEQMIRGYLDGLSYDQISFQTGRSVKELKSHMLIYATYMSISISFQEAAKLTGIDESIIIGTYFSMKNKSHSPDNKTSWKRTTK